MRENVACFSHARMQATALILNAFQPLAPPSDTHLFPRRAKYDGDTNRVVKRGSGGEMSAAV
jgi:hypothetical protein